MEQWRFVAYLAWELMRDPPLLYLLPLLTAVAAVMSVLWYLDKQRLQKLENELGEKSGLAEQRERDLAQEELFRRHYEERELNKEKAQFQAQTHGVREVCGTGGERTADCRHQC